jgi:acetylornithine deacetylase/succinyl-diaminopimelate desuccinylase-like protein
MFRFAAALAASTLMAGAALAAAAPKAPADTGEPAFRALYKELVETNTTFSAGDCTLAATRVADRLKAAGFADDQLRVIVPPNRPKDGNLVAIYPGKDPKAKAVLLLAHIDVVEAKREDWTRDPFSFIEENGYFYARGVSDDKAQAAIWADMLIRFKREGYQPKRTVKMALTCGEEGGGQINGARFLSQNNRDLIDAGIALNEGGAGALDAAGRQVTNNVLVAEKYPVSFTLEVTNPGGHSSRPVPDNAIYRLARALDRLSQYEFPVQFNDATRGYFGRMSKVVGGEEGAAMAAILATPQDAKADALLSKNPSYHAYLRTTCVATMLEAGHAANALPQRARATVNCRILPAMTIPEVQAAIEKAVADPQVKVTAGQRVMVAAVPPPLTPKVLGSDREGHRRDVARRPGHSDDGGRRHRLHLAQRRRHPGLRRLRHLHRSRPRRHPRAERAGSRPLGHGGPRVPLPAGQGLRRAEGLRLAPLARGVARPRPQERRLGVRAGRRRGHGLGRRRAAHHPRPHGARRPRRRAQGPAARSRPRPSSPRAPTRSSCTPWPSRRPTRPPKTSTCAPPSPRR